MVNYLTSDIQGNIWAATSGGIQWFESIPGIQVVLGTPLLIAPAYGQDEVSVTPELSWTTISGATAYQLQVATDNAFENLVVDEDNVSTTSITLPELEDDMMFYWRVAATNGTLTSSWSFAYNFITEYIEGVIDFGTDDAITIYPVPFDNYLIIESASIDVSGGIASIYSLDGRLRKQIALVEERARINTGDLPKGAYILQISDGSVQYNCKIVK